MKQLTYTPLQPTEDGKGFMDEKGKIWQPLNSKQKKFCREYFKGQTATESRGTRPDFLRESSRHSTRPQRRSQGPRTDIRCHHSRGTSRQSGWTLHR